MITVVDFGIGNIGSMLNMLRRLGEPAVAARDAASLRAASKLILPGVGAFDAAMQRLNAAPGMRNALEQFVLVERRPVLGVCLGMQLLLDGSEEGALGGLGWIKGIAMRFPRDTGLKVPHMGWNAVRLATPTPLTDGIDEASRYYFVHSYYARVENPAHSVMKCTYGIEFDAAIGRENVFGVQFHPEKSHRHGMNFLAKFAAL